MILPIFSVLGFILIPFLLNEFTHSCVIKEEIDVAMSHIYMFKIFPEPQSVFS